MLLMEVAKFNPKDLCTICLRWDPCCNCFLWWCEPDPWEEIRDLHIVPRTLFYFCHCCKCLQEKPIHPVETLTRVSLYNMCDYCAMIYKSNAIDRIVLRW